MIRRTARQLQFRSYKGIPFLLRILLNDSVVAATLSLPLLGVHNPLRNPPRAVAVSRSVKLRPRDALVIM